MSETKKKFIFAGAIGIAVLLFFLITGNAMNEQDHEKNIHAAIESPHPPPGVEVIEETAPDTAVIDVKGEVNRPGVYEVSTDSRVNDLIELAGGFTEEADVHQINLAQKVHDEMSIIVFKKGDETAGGFSAKVESDGKVRINYATAEEIQTLSGIGPSKAQAIIKHREENGLFQQPEDLLEISGIGEKTLENFIDQIQIP